MKLRDVSSFDLTFYDANDVPSTFHGPVSPLKYGEAMANAAAWVKTGERFKLLNPDRPVGFVNHLDVLAAARFMLTTNGTGIFKHTGACGAAYGFDDRAEEYRAASGVDEVARFGGVIGVPLVTKESAIAMVGKTGKKKQDGVVALEYEEGAAEILLGASKPPLVFKLTDPDFDIINMDIQHGIDGYVLQERIPPLQRSDLKTVAGNNVTDKVLDDIVFGFKVADTRYSNSICFVHPTDAGTIAVGISGGASDRITAAYQAMEKAVAYFLVQYLSTPIASMPDSLNAVLYMVSDGFFPDTAALKVATPEEIEVVIGRQANFPYQMQREDFLGRGDLAELLKAEGTTIRDKLRFVEERLNLTVPVIYNPMGSASDGAVVEFARANNMTMLTGERDGKHMRCFKHSPQSAFKVR